jgi:hypothetical protein
MSSQTLQQTIESKKLSAGWSHDEQGRLIFQTASPSVYQEDYEEMSFNPPSQNKPGTVLKCRISLKRDKVDVESDHFISWDTNTTDATNYPTFYNDALSQVQSIYFQFNDGSTKISFADNNAIFNAFQEYFCELLKEGKSVTLAYKKFMANLTSFSSGVTVTSAASKHFYLWLNPLINFKNLITTGSVEYVDVTLQFAAAPTDANNALRICKSSTTSAAYKQNVITFDNVAYGRTFTRLRDSALIPRNYFNDGSSVIIVQRVDELVVSGISWNTPGTDRFTKKLSEISKSEVQSLKAFVVKAGTLAYNDASAGIKYSGPNYITWARKELFGTEKLKLDFTANIPQNQWKLKNYMNETYQMRYGVDPPEFITDYTASPHIPYFGLLTHIPFDHVKIAEQHSELVTHIDPQTTDITLECAGAVGTECDVHIWAIVYEYYKLVQVKNNKGEVVGVEVKLIEK